MSRKLAYDILVRVTSKWEDAADVRLEFEDKAARERMRAALYAVIAHDRRLSQKAYEAKAMPSPASTFDDVLIHTEGDKMLIVRLDDGSTARLVSLTNLPRKP